MGKKYAGIFVVIFTVCSFAATAYAVVDDQSEDLTSVIEDPGPVNPETVGANADTPLKAIISEDGIAEPVPQTQKDVVAKTSEAVQAVTSSQAVPKEPPQGAASEAAHAPMPAAGAPAPVAETETVSKAEGPEKPAAPPPALPNPFPSGLLEIEGFKYPVFLYAPPEYRPDRAYPMILVAPNENIKPEEGIKYFKGLADRKNIFILSVYGLWPRSGAVPYQLDEWLLDIKKDVSERFPIDRDKIFIVGKGEGASYAAYLAMKYPDQFGAAALIGGGWDGQFSAIMEVRSEFEKQLPFLAVFTADQPEVKQKNQAWMDKLQAKGYPIKMMEVKSSAELKELEFKKALFDWLDTTTQKWDMSLAEKKKTWKAKVRKGVKDFFTV